MPEAAVLERPQMPQESYGTNFKEIVALEKQVIDAQGRARRSGRQEDIDAYEALKRGYESFSVKDRLEARFENYLKGDATKERKEKGAKPSDAGGDTLYFQERIDDQGKKIKTESGNIMWDLIVGNEKNDFNGWNNETVAQVSETTQHFFETNLPKDCPWNEHKQQAFLEFLVTSGIRPDQISEQLTSERLNLAINYAKGDIENPEQHPEIVRAGWEYFLQGFNIRKDYVEHYFLPEMFARDLAYERQGDTTSVEHLGWKIGMQDSEFSLTGDFPVLEHRIIKKKNPDGSDSRDIDWKKSKLLYVNKGNFNRWLLHRMDILFGARPRDVIDYFQEIRLKTGPISMYDIPLGELMQSADPLLKSEHEWLDTVSEFEQDLQMDSMNMLSARMAYLSDTFEIKGDEKKIVEVAGKFAQKNIITNKAYGANVMQHSAASPLNMKGSTESGVPRTSDGIKGAAWNEVKLLYLHISDFAKLQEIAGAGSSLFTREAMDQAMFDYVKKMSGQTGRLDARDFLKENLYKAYATAFSAGDRVIEGQAFTGRRGPHGEYLPDIVRGWDGRERLLTAKERARMEAFCSLINLFDNRQADSNQAKFIREALIPNIIKERYGFTTERGKLDKASLFYAERLGYDWTSSLLTGAWSMNDESAQAFRGWTKWIRTLQYRLKMTKDKSSSRAGALGNERNMYLFKDLYLPFTWAVKTKSGKSPEQVFEELHEMRMNHTNYLKQLRTHLEQQGKAKERIDAEVAEEKRQLEQRYLNKIAELECNEEAQATHFDDHTARVDKLWNILVNAKEINFEEFTTYDYMTGMRHFKREAFQQKIQDDFLKPLRYAYETYGDIDFSRRVRMPRVVPDPRKQFAWKTEWTDMPIGEAMFGHELLDREELWMEAKDRDGKPIKGVWLFQQDENGNYKRKKNGDKIHMIDYDKVNKNKLLIWKQWALLKVAADIQAHRLNDRNMDPPYHPSYYKDIFTALKNIPGAIWGDEYSMSGIIVPEDFFDKNDMRILKHKAFASPMENAKWIPRPLRKLLFGENTAMARFYLGWLWRDLVAAEDEEGWGFGLMLSTFIKNVNPTKSLG